MFQTKELLVKSIVHGKECLQDFIILLDSSAALQKGPKDVSFLARIPLTLLSGFTIVTNR